MTMLTRALAVLAPVALVACTVGPDFKTPEPPSVQGYTAHPLPATASAPVDKGAAQRFVPGGDIAADWWRLFHSEPLNALVEQALAANPTLPAAQAALRQALENVAAQRGSYYPSLSAGLDASRNLTPVSAISPASASGNPYYSLVTPQLNVSFVPDVFGANARAVESLQAQADNQRFMLEATRLTLIIQAFFGASFSAMNAPMNGMNIGALTLRPNRLATTRCPHSCTKISSTKPSANHQPQFIA